MPNPPNRRKTVNFFFVSKTTWTVKVIDGSSSGEGRRDEGPVREAAQLSSQWDVQSVASGRRIQKGPVNFPRLRKWIFG